MILFYTNTITARVNYIVKFFFDDLLGVSYKITSNENEFKSFGGAKINYSKSRFNDEFYIEASDLLFEKNIREQNVVVDSFNEYKIFFKAKTNASLAFDIFAASFYLITRYEEYLTNTTDKYERFIATESLAFKNNFLHIPSINYWAKYLKTEIRTKYPSIIFSERKYSYISTIDVDNVYCYLGKGVLRTFGGYLKSLARRDFRAIRERTKVLLGKQTDPFDQYLYQLNIAEKYRLKMIYFLLFAKKSKYDGAVSPKSNKYKHLLNFLTKHAEIGIHPSFRSHKSYDTLVSEIQNLSKEIKKSITKSRQHFLKLKLPETYLNLIRTNIKEDYSMGYASHLGFRASTCTPFNFYDLKNEIETDLKIFPFAIMDVTLIHYMKLSPFEAFKYIKPIIDTIKTIDGLFISIWHDRVFSDKGEYNGWKKVYEEMIINGKEL